MSHYGWLMKTWRTGRTTNIQIGGPIWLLQLWLNAIFEPSLKTEVPPNLEVGVEGLRLAKLTPDDGKVVSIDIFEDYFQIGSKT